MLLGVETLQPAQSEDTEVGGGGEGRKLTALHSKKLMPQLNADLSIWREKKRLEYTTKWKTGVPG